MSSIVSALQSLGTDLGSIFGSGGANNFAAGNVAGGQFGTPFGNSSPASLQNAFQSQGPVDPQGNAQTGATPDSSSPFNMSGIAKMYAQYLLARGLQQPNFVGGHSTPVTQQPQFNPFTQTPAAIMPPQVQL